MPNLECRPHLLSTISMMERKRQAKTASATATETWREGGDTAQSTGPEGDPGLASDPDSWCLRAGILGHELAHRRGKGPAAIYGPPHPPQGRLDPGLW